MSTNVTNPVPNSYPSLFTCNARYVFYININKVPMKKKKLKTNGLVLLAK